MPALQSHGYTLDLHQAYAREVSGNHSDPKSGKWLIPLSEEKLDEIWPAVKQATEEGKLGQSSMAAQRS
jgi:hypothetical protein